VWNDSFREREEREDTSRNREGWYLGGVEDDAKQQRQEDMWRRKLFRRDGESG